FELNRRRAEALRARRDAVHDADADVAAARRLSGYRDPGPAGDAVFMGRHRREGYVIEKYILRGEGDYPVPFLLLRSQAGPPAPVVLYLDPRGKDAGAAPGGELERLV